MTDKQEAIDTKKREEAIAYVRSIVVPLLEAGDVKTLQFCFEVVEQPIKGQSGELKIEPVQVLRITLPEARAGFLIGKHGATAIGLRNLLRAWAGAQHWHTKVDVYVGS